MSKQLILRYTYQGASSAIQLILGILIAKDFGLEILGLWSVLIIALSFLSGLFANFTLYKFYLNRFSFNRNIILEFSAFIVLNIVVFVFFKSGVDFQFLIFAIIRNIEGQITEAYMRRKLSINIIPYDSIVVKILTIIPLVTSLQYSSVYLVMLGALICLLSSIYMSLNLKIISDFQYNNTDNHVAKNNLISFFLYFLKSQFPNLLLAYLSIAALGGLTMARYLLTPILFLGPVLSNLMLSTNSEEEFFNFKYISVFIIFYGFFATLFSGKLLAIFSYDVPNGIGLLVLLVFINTILAVIRTFHETKYMKMRRTRKLLMINSSALLLCIPLSFLLINFTGGAGAVLTLILLELFSILLIQKYDSVIL